MKIPEFKPSKHFLGDTDLPCLLAKVRNSELPGGIANRYIKSLKKNPKCEIYLRGKDPNKISAWQRQMLERLFVKADWVPAIRPDLKRCEADYGADYLACGLEPAEMKYLKQHGLLPLFALQCVVVDDIKRMVVMSVDTGMVDEHGLAIYLNKGRWRLGDRDRFGRYSQRFDAQRETRKERKADDRQSQWDKKWAGFFPIPESGSQIESDISPLCGDWRYDRHATARMLKKVGESKAVIGKVLSALGVTPRYLISTKEIRPVPTVYGHWASRVSKTGRQGTRIKVLGRTRSRSCNMDRTWTTTFEFCCHNDLFVQRGSFWVYRRVGRSGRKA